MIGLLFACVVAAALDGDSLACADGLHVRLWAVDSVEKGDPAWKPARDALRALAPPGTALACETKGISAGRVVARCRLQGPDLGAEQVKAGLATACPAFDPVYVPLQRPDHAPYSAFCAPPEPAPKAGP